MTHLLKIIYLRMFFPKPQPHLVNVFINSKIYGGIYDGEQLPVNKWVWPNKRKT